MAIKVTTLSVLQDLEREMSRAGRAPEEQALREAVQALARPERGLLTTGRAAERLGVSIPTVKRWIERGALAGGLLGGRWLVAEDSVERLVRLRQALVALDAEGNPSDEEVHSLIRRKHDRSHAVPA